MHGKAWWMFVAGVLVCGAVSRMDRHLEAAGPSLQTAGDRTFGRQAGAPDGGRRLALVVGNDAYPDSPLRNAVNDARAVAAALEDVGFTVTKVENASRARMTGVIGDFAADLSGDDVALFYFAGHGVQVGDSPENYLIPTDFDGRTESAVRLNALKAADVVGELRRARVAMAVFDACRNNPYRGGRGGPAGLAAMEARGTLIAYAADAGQTASDNPEGQNGLFTQHFVAALREPGLTATALFQRVRRGVVAASRERQWPAVYDSLLADFVFRAPVVPVVTATELEYWRNVQAMDTAVAYRSYERQYPNGRFVELSRLRWAELREVTGGGGPAVAGGGPEDVAGGGPEDVAGGGPAVAGDLSTSAAVRVFRDCDFCPEMVVIPAGTFRMGAPAEERGREDDEGPQHLVTLRSFAMGVKEVTFDEWEACVRDGGCNGYRPDDHGWGRGSRPVINVSWEHAQAYVSWLSESTGAAYRLPSESEWEYAARAGTATPFHSGSANYNREYLRRGMTPGTMPAGTFAPNRFGLYDVAGNVEEWVRDCWHDDYSGAPSDGKAWLGREDCRRVLRGGAWNSSSSFYFRFDLRRGSAAGYRYNYAGFRVSRTLD